MQAVPKETPEKASKEVRSKRLSHDLKVGSLIFSPSWVPTLVTFLLLCLLINLGFWQLRRADYKEVLVQRLEDRSHTQENTLDTLKSFGNDVADYPLDLQGHYLNQFNFLLDNRVHNGIAGFDVLTPFVTENSIILVNRGWLPQGRSRTEFPDIPAEIGERKLEGLIHVPNPATFVLKEDDYAHVTWPFLIQKIDLAKIAPLFDQPVASFVLRLKPDSASSFLRDWQSNFMGPEKHYGYAVQWFSLAAALFIIYLTVNTRKKKKQV